MNLNKLKEPFHEEDIEWRVQSSGVTNNKPWAIVVPYVTARAIMDRLDKVCGQANWQNDLIGIDGGIICRIGIKIESEWVWKADGAQNTNIEPVKGGISGALKRAGVPWDIGRYLYSLDTPQYAIISDKGKHKSKIDNKWLKWDAPKLPSWALPETKKAKAEDI
jgi:hypothetical protein